MADPVGEIYGGDFATFCGLIRIYELVFKIKILGQNWVYDEDLRLLTLKTKNWPNNFLSRRFGKYSYYQNVENYNFG